MKILELGLKNVCFFYNDVKKEAEARGHIIDFYFANSLTVDLGGKSLSLEVDGQDLNQYDLIHVGPIQSNRWPWIATLGYLHKTNNCVIIDKRLTENTLDQYSGLSKYFSEVEHGLAMPRSIVFKQAKYIKDKLKDFTFPVVVKTNTSSSGKGVMLAHSFEDIAAFTKKIYNEGKCVGFVLREFIPNNGDYRVTVIDNKAEVCLKRTAQKSGEFRSNISLGGLLTSTENEDTKEICQVAEKISRLGNFDIAGVDVMVHEKTGIPYILEVNRIPGDLHDDVAVSGVDLAKLIVNMYEKRVKEYGQQSK